MREYYIFNRLAKILKTLTILIFVKTQNSRNCQHSEPFLVRIQNGVLDLEDSLTVSYKGEYSLIIQYRNWASTYLPNRDENLCLHKNLQTHVYSKFIYNHQNWKQPKCPTIDEWINKWWYIYTMKYHLAIKRNELSSHTKI